MVDTVRTELDLLTNLFQDGQADNSITAQDIRDFIVSVKYLNGGGWDFHFDSVYTLASPRAIGAGIRTQVTIDGLRGDFGHPSGTDHTQHFWNTTTNKIEPPNLNDFGHIRLAFTGKSNSDPDNYVDIELDIGGGIPPVIFKDTKLFAKGATVTQEFNVIIPLFAGPDFIANGGTLYITPKSASTYWDFALTSERTYLAKP